MYYPTQSQSVPQSHPLGIAIAIALISLLSSGCHDGPLYALKQANPYYALREWKQDRDLGVTDHERREELLTLSRTIGGMSAGDQAFWASHLDRIMTHDPSAEMRRLAVVAAGRLKNPSAIALIEKGLDDQSVKVQMEACRSLGKREEPEAAQMLASTLGTTPENDVRNKAIEALGKHKGNIPLEALRIALDDTDPATLDLAMNSLRGVMGTDHGNDPKTWIAAIDAQTAPVNSTAPQNPPLPGTAEDSIRFAGREENLKR